MAFHPILRPAAALVLLLTLAQTALAQQAPPGADYLPGQGLAVGNTGVSVGGYATAQWQNLEREDSAVSLSHMSLFVWSELGNHAKFLAELDNQENHLGHHEREREGGRFLSVERLYLDYSFSDRLTVRAGKFLTPIGRWNQLHADPLVWTTSRPLLTHDLFPDNVTGVMAMGNATVAGQALDYMVYHSVGGEVRPDPAQDPFDDAYGARVVLPLSDSVQLGVSAARYDQVAPAHGLAVGEVKRLVGLDFLWAARGYELSSELLYRRSSQGPAQTARGAFVQAAVPLDRGLSAVARIELIRNPQLPQQQRRAVLGLNYRVNSALSLKVESLHDFNHDGSASGVLASLSVLF